MSPATTTTTSFKDLHWKTRFRYWLGTLFYHSQFSLDYTVDVLVEPLLQFAECYTRFLGRFFVLGVMGMISLVVFTVHTIGFRFYWENKSPGLTMVLTMVGYWLLINVLFNYFCALAVSPGQPDDLEKLRNCLCTICKPCISPKPPRTHHCSVCRKCYLKMDHHCPWVNNCIGHYNHRYFYLTAAYIVTGCGFVMIFGAEIAFKCFFGSEDILLFQRYYDEDRKFGSVSNNRTGRGSSNGEEISSLGASKLIFLTLLGMPFSSSTADWESSLETAETVGGIRLSRIGIKILIVLTTLICIGASVLLGGLCWWHGRLISKGETSIEQLVNNNKRKMDENYVNIYDLGVRENWRIFWGIDQPGRSFWRHVLLPSMHKPSGDGYDWSHLVRRRQGQGPVAGDNTKQMTTTSDNNDDTSICLSPTDDYRTKTE